MVLTVWTCNIYLKIVVKFSEFTFYTFLSAESVHGWGMHLWVLVSFVVGDTILPSHPVSLDICKMKDESGELSDHLLVWNSDSLRRCWEVEEQKALELEGLRIRYSWSRISERLVNYFVSPSLCSAICKMGITILAAHEEQFYCKSNLHLWSSHYLEVPISNHSFLWPGFYMELANAYLFACRKILKE